MKEKLSSYAQDQLPGGCYWEQVQDMCELKPSNDVCAIPNLQCNQMARSNLKTLKWLSNFPGDKQSVIVNLAVKPKEICK